MTTAADYAAPIALKRGLVSAAQLEAAQQRIAAHTDLTTPAPDLLDLLVADAGLDRAALERAVAEEFGMPWVALGAREIAPDVRAALPRSFIVEHTAIPFAREQGTLLVALASLTLLAGCGPRNHQDLLDWMAEQGKGVAQWLAL